MAAFYSLTRFLVWCAIIIGLIIGALRLTMIRWVRLPTMAADPVFSLSVLPTLEGGDLILTFRLGTPDFGDLVLCPEPGAPERYIIGRVFGEGGDRVKITNSVPTVNGDSFVLERSCDPSVITYRHPETGAEVKQQCHMEAVAGGLHPIGVGDGQKIVPENREYNVPDGRWFLLSDNRLYPYDSRDYGYVDAASCKERVFGRLVSQRGWKDVNKRLTYIP